MRNKKGIVPLSPSTYQGTILGMPQLDSRLYVEGLIVLGPKSEVILRPPKNGTFGSGLVRTTLVEIGICVLCALL